MFRLFHSLRFRLTALNLIIFGLTQATSLAVFLTLREAQVRNDFDRWLEADALRMTEEIAANAEAVLPELETRALPTLDPFHAKGYCFQLRRLDGVSLVKSSNLADADLPLSDAASDAKTRRLPVIETIDASTYGPAPGAAGSIRLLTVYCGSLPGNALYLQVGARLDRVDEAIARLRELLLTVFVVSMLAVGLGSWFMAGQALRPVRWIAAAARQLTIDRLEQRLTPPTPHGDLAEMVASLNGMLDRIERGFRAQERFSAEVSHELRTPISILLGESQVLRRTARSTTEYEKFLRSVETEMHHLARTVESLLLLARANAGFPTTLRDVVSLNDVVTDATRRCAAVASHQGVELVTRLPMPEGDEPELLVRGDMELLIAMVNNLILNAIRHSPSGRPVEIGLSTANGTAVISVRDEGPGIPDQLLAGVFDPFTSRPPDFASTPDAVRGTGLGLAIVKSVAGLHGGTVDASNLKPTGCRFSVQLPIQ